MQLRGLLVMTASCISARAGTCCSQGLQFVAVVWSLPDQLSRTGSPGAQMPGKKWLVMQTQQMCFACACAGLRLVNLHQAKQQCRPQLDGSLNKSADAAAVCGEVRLMCARLIDAHVHSSSKPLCDS